MFRLVSVRSMAELGSDPGSVLRIVGFFDDLGDSAANADTLVRSAALLAGCPVGARWPVGTLIRYDATGQLAPDDRLAPPEPADDLAVWLERDRGAHPLDAVLLDRLRYALRHTDSRGIQPRLGDPALLELVLSSKEHRADRARAIRLLGLDETRDCCVLAVSAHSPPEAVRIITGALPGAVVRSATLGTATAMLCQRTPDIGDTRALSDRLERAIVEAFPAPRTTGADRGPWVGIGLGTNVFGAATAWRQALRALRFASSTGYGRRAVAYGRLSALELLADLPIDEVRRNPDFARIEEIAATPAGALAVSTVEAFFVFGSLRRTADELHVHHSTVAARLAQVEAQLGWDLDDPMERFMATLVLMVRRIILSRTELAEAERSVTDPDSRRTNGPDPSTPGG